MLVRCVNLRLFTRFDRGLRFPWKNKQTKTKQAWPQKSFSTTQKQPLDGITTLNYRNSPGVLSIMVYTESPPPPRKGYRRLHVYEREGISLVEVYERIRKSVINPY